jgi:hypothetical protein
VSARCCINWKRLTRHGRTATLRPERRRQTSKG